MDPRRCRWTVPVALALLAGCETTVPAEPTVPPGPTAQPAAPAPDAEEPPPPGPEPLTAHSAVALLSALCQHAKAGDHAWVGARVRLPLHGIHSMNAQDADQFVHPNDTTAVEEFQSMRYCHMLPEAGTALREFEIRDTTAAGLVDFGPMPHRVEFDVSTDPPVLLTLDAQVLPRPVPERPSNAREYTLGAPPRGFTDKEPRAAPALRRDTVAFLRANPGCIEDYASKDFSAVRFEVVAETDAEGVSTLRVEPFQLVRASLLACLRGQLPKAPGLARRPPTRAIVEVLIPVSADELPPGTPVIEMGRP